jgi:hypothetical protein
VVLPFKSSLRLRGIWQNYLNKTQSVIIIIVVFLITTSPDPQIYRLNRLVAETSRRVCIIYTEYRNPHWLDGKRKSFDFVR